MLRVIIILGLVSLSAFAAETEPAHVEEKTKTEVQEPEDLMTVNETTTVSKKVEPIWHAPGVVSLVGKVEMELFGDSNFEDVMARMAGVQNTFGTAINRTSIRGGNPIASAAHVLVLVDSRPVRASGGNLSSYSPAYTFPTSQIERVEVSRGPGSVMHGTNAMEGVINIITKKGQGNSFNVNLEGGTFGTQKFEMSSSYRRNNFSIDAGLLFSETEGWSFRSAALDGSSFSKDVFEDNRGVNLHIGYKDFTLSLTHGDMKQFSLLAFTENDPLSYASEVTVLDFNYHKLIGTWNFDAHITQNHEVFDWRFGTDNIFPLRSNDWLGEITAYGQIGEVALTLGTVVQRLDASTNGGLVSTPYSGITKTYSFYGQMEYQATERVVLSAGAQYNKTASVDALFGEGPANVPEDVDADVVPRLGVVWNFAPHSRRQNGMKLIYGEAFRSPSLLEYVIDTPGYQLGNPDLRPETIETWDLQFFSHGNKYQAALTGYRSNQKDLITLIPDAQYALGRTQNVGSVKSKGVEVEIKYLPSEKWYYQLAYTWQENESSESKLPSSLLPGNNWKLGFGFNGQFIKIGLFDQHDGAYKKSNNPDVIFLNPPSKAIHVLNLNINFDLTHSKLFSKVDDFKFYARVNNLLDEEVWVAEFLSGAYNTKPGGSGRAFYAGIRIGL